MGKTKYGSLQFWCDRANRLQYLEFDDDERQYEFAQIFWETLEKIKELDQNKYKWYVKDMYLTVCGSSLN